MATCNDCYNLFMCMQYNPKRYKQNWDNDTVCNNFEDDSIEDLEELD